VTSAPSTQSAAALLCSVTDRLQLVVDGEDIAGNLEAALRDLLVAAFCSGGGDVPLEVVHGCVLALARAEPVVIAFYLGSPQPETVNYALRSAAGLVEHAGTPRSERSAEAQRLLPNWADWVLILLAEMEAEACLRRIRARLDPHRGTEPSPPSHRLH
jgi:hypothetical protein